MTSCIFLIFLFSLDWLATRLEVNFGVKMTVKKSAIGNIIGEVYFL